MKKNSICQKCENQEGEWECIECGAYVCDDCSTHIENDIGCMCWECFEKRGEK